MIASIFSSVILIIFINGIFAETFLKAEASLQQTSPSIVEQDLLTAPASYKVIAQQFNNNANPPVSVTQSLYIYSGDTINNSTVSTQQLNANGLKKSDVASTVSDTTVISGNFTNNQGQNFYNGWPLYQLSANTDDKGTLQGKKDTSSNNYLLELTGKGDIVFSNDVFVINNNNFIISNSTVNNYGSYFLTSSSGKTLYVSPNDRLLQVKASNQTEFIPLSVPNSDIAKIFNTNNGILLFDQLNAQSAINVGPKINPKLVSAALTNFNKADPTKNTAVYTYNGLPLYTRNITSNAAETVETKAESQGKVSNNIQFFTIDVSGKINTNLDSSKNETLLTPYTDAFYNFKTISAGLIKISLALLAFIAFLF